MEQLSEHQIQAWMTTFTPDPASSNGERPPPSRIEAFIAELLLSGVTITEITRAAQRSTPWKERPGRIMDTAEDVARLLRVKDA